MTSGALRLLTGEDRHMLLTSLTIAVAVLYALIAGFALFMTYDERKRAGTITPFYTALSVVACLAWPVTVVVVAVTALVLQRRPAPAAATEVQTAG